MLFSHQNEKRIPLLQQELSESLETLGASQQDVHTWKSDLENVAKGLSFNKNSYLLSISNISTKTF